jgi:uncharacterized metal-binding protein
MADGTKIIFACSGAADVGEVSDLAARQLKREGAGKMDCLTAIGARHGGKLNGARQADTLLAIDGCPQSCASKVLRDAGFKDCLSLQLADLGMNKGETPASAESIAKVVAKAKEMLA